MLINLIQESKSLILSGRDGHSILNDTYIILKLLALIQENSKMWDDINN